MTSVAPTENEIELMPAVTAARIRANKPKMVTMTLLRHYRPAGEFEIAGWNKPTIERKNVAGKMVVIEEGGFIPNEAAPSPTPGTGTPGKLWAGTVIRVPADEARTMRKNGIGEAEIED